MIDKEKEVVNRLLKQDEADVNLPAIKEQEEPDFVPTEEDAPINPKTNKPDKRLIKGFKGMKFQDYLNQLTPAQRTYFLEKKAAERQVKKVFEAKIEARAGELTDDLVKLGKKLITRKKASAFDFQVVFDRLVGPKAQELDITSKGQELPMLNLEALKVVTKDMKPQLEKPIDGDAEEITDEVK